MPPFSAFRVVGSVVGLSELVAGMAASRALVQTRTRQHLRLVAEEIRTESLRLVPIDTGRLAGSAFVRQVDPDTVEVGYATDYALYVHEIPPPGGDPATVAIAPLLHAATRTARHESPRQWKYLELPARRRLGTLAREFEEMNVLSGIQWRVVF